MTPPEKLRELADRLESAQRTRDRQALPAIAQELLVIVDDIERTLDPIAGMGSLARAQRERARKR